MDDPEDVAAASQVGAFACMKVPIKVVQPESNFRFIDVSQDTPEQRSRNRTIARSHIMKNIRKERRKSQEFGGRGNQKRLFWQEKIVDGLHISNQFEQAGAVPNPNHGLNYEKLTARRETSMSLGLGVWSTQLDSDINPMLLPGKRGTPLVYQTINHYLDVIWPLHWPATPPSAPSPMAVEWWAMFRSSPMLFHASTHAAATHLDSLRSSTALTRTPEALAHKTEAIRLINDSLSEMLRSGKAPQDALLMSILAMTSETRDEGLDINEQRLGCPMFRCPFQPPMIQVHWQEQFAKLRNDRSHEDALFALLQMKGGIESVSPFVRKVIVHHELKAAAVEVRHPRVGWYEDPVITVLENDLSVNVLMVPPAIDPGAGFCLLAEHGLSEHVVNTLIDLQKITMIIEAYSMNTLQSPNLLSITSRRNRVAHEVLSLPTKEELPGMPEEQSTLYELCRIAALVHVLAILFPLPHFTGVIARLVQAVQSLIDSMDVQILCGPTADAVIWALYVSGTAAESFPQRIWFVQKLKTMLASVGIVRWVGLKALLGAFLWMDSVMDGPAMTLWDEIASMSIE